jgi:Macrocin-O-methyltransferase (TylF)
MLKKAAQSSLAALGARSPFALLHGMNDALNYMWAGHWMRSHDLKVERRFKTREQIFEFAASQIAHDEVLYLEFGVFGGTSLALWSRLLKNPASKLHGFDSFEGLPESYEGIDIGYFDMAGVLPDIKDQRVTLFKGWFSDTIPKYKLPPHDKLFVTFDADLYSSTKIVLDFIEPHVVPGTYFYFDEFEGREHEMKAFGEFLTATEYKFRALAATPGWGRVLFQCVSADRKHIART